MQIGQDARGGQSFHVRPQQGAGPFGLPFGHKAFFLLGKQGVQALHRVRGENSLFLQSAGGCVIFFGLCPGDFRIAGAGVRHERRSAAQSGQFLPDALHFLPLFPAGQKPPHPPQFAFFGSTGRVQVVQGLFKAVQPLLKFAVGVHIRGTGAQLFAQVGKLAGGVVDGGRSRDGVTFEQGAHAILKLLEHLGRGAQPQAEGGAVQGVAHAVALEG